MNSKHLRTSSKLLPRQSPESGIALIAVLWVLLLLSTLAATVGYVTRANAMLAHRALEVAQAEAAGDSAVVDTISSLSGQQNSGGGLARSGEHTWEFQGIEVTLSVTKEAGRIDLNGGNKALLSAFLQSQGISTDTAATMLADLAEGSGRSGSHVGEAGVPIQNSILSPNGHKLRVVDELRQLPNWKTQPIGCWVDSFTVYTGLSEVSAADAAVPAVSEALHWAQAHHVEDRDWITNVASTPSAFGETSVIGSVLRIVASARVNDVTAKTMWIGRITGDRQTPVLTMKWDHPSQATDNSCQIASKHVPAEG